MQMARRLGSTLPMAKCRGAQPNICTVKILIYQRNMRDYKRERQLYYGYGTASSVTPEQRKHRKEMQARQEAREKMKGVVKKNQDVHHVNGNPRDNRKSNLKAVSRHYNRSKNKH